MDEKEAKVLNPQVLAFVGDGVYSLYIRHKLMLSGNLQGADLHKEVINYVKASGQSNFIEKLLPSLNDIELSIFKRARNYHTQSQPKNGNIIDYKRATGLEALIGYLYLTGNENRLNEILEQSIGEKNED
jgi:ribonuclease-3 family protein